MTVPCILGVLLFAQSGPTVSPTHPIVEQGTSVKFRADEEVTWKVTGGGTIEADGTYHAPANFTAPQSLGGYQIGPANSIFHTRIDSMPVHPKSEAWLRWMKAEKTRITVGPGLCKVNFVGAGQPTIPMKFVYTPDENRPYPVPTYSNLTMESGIWAGLFPDGRAIGFDRHIAILDRDAEKAYEIYNWHHGPIHRGQPAPETAQGGETYDLMSYDLPTGGVNAGSLP